MHAIQYFGMIKAKISHRHGISDSTQFTLPKTTSDKGTLLACPDFPVIRQSVLGSSPQVSIRRVPPPPGSVSDSEQDAVASNRDRTEKESAPLSRARLTKIETLLDDQLSYIRSLYHTQQTQQIDSTEKEAFERFLKLRDKSKALGSIVPGPLDGDIDAQCLWWIQNRELDRYSTQELDFYNQTIARPAYRNQRAWLSPFMDQELLHKRFSGQDDTSTLDLAMGLYSNAVNLETKPKFHAKMYAFKLPPGGGDILLIHAHGQQLYEFLPRGMDGKTQHVDRVYKNLCPPTFVHYSGKTGVWLIPKEGGDLLSTALTAYLMHLQEDRWVIWACCKRELQGALLVAGQLTDSEVSTLEKGGFPPLLAKFGRKGEPYEHSGAEPDLPIHGIHQTQDQLRYGQAVDERGDQDEAGGDNDNENESTNGTQETDLNVMLARLVHLDWVDNMDKGQEDNEGDDEEKDECGPSEAKDKHTANGTNYENVANEAEDEHKPEETEAEKRARKAELLRVLRSRFA